ncbi:MAG: exodeoxyribonuclease VII small subunit [Candidatus Eisenbacteria bacterium]|nr:exodeoxyribonuclease VII small subunit [Candidatus Eisenbacteria bacterium]
MKDSRDKPGGRTFEQALGRLEELVDGLERGNLSLEESLAYFEEGTRLIQECTSMLEAAEARLQKLTPAGEGFRLEPLTFPDDETSAK